jgi:hypothetical protein
VAYYWDNPVKHDRPLITNCFVPGLACAAGLNPSSAIEEQDLDMLLTNVALADQEERPLSYSLHRGHQYQGISFDRVRSGVAKMVYAGLAIERRTKPGQRGRQSDLRGIPALDEIFDKHGQKPIYGPRDSIIVRSRKDGSLLPMRPSRELAHQVDRVNEMLRGVELGLGMTGAIKLANNLWLFERLEEEDQFGNPRLIQQRLRLDQMAGRRVFTSDHKKHGRFYCPAQNIPGSARLQMTLSGEQVVELDFQSMHVALAYSLCGARMDGDPYEGIPGFTRKQAKAALLTAFNSIKSIDMEAAIASLTDNRKGKRVCATRGEAKRLLEALKIRHAPIEKMICSDAGMRLMNLDARIMLSAVDRLIAKGIDAIPIHDSIVVAEHHESEAREALNFGWHSQNPQLTPCHIEKKRQKVSQYGCEGPGALSSCPVDQDRGSEGWWSSVIAVARFDVAEWVAA